MTALRHEGGPNPEQEAAKLDVIKPFRGLNLRVFGSETELRRDLTALHSKIEHYNADWAVQRKENYVVAAEEVKYGRVEFTVGNKKTRLFLLEDPLSRRLSLDSDDPDLKVAIFMGFQPAEKSKK